MEDHIVEIIVNEVIRRIKVLINTHKGLVICTENTDIEVLEIFINSMEAQGFILDCIYVKGTEDKFKEITCLDNARIIKVIEKNKPVFDFKEIVEEYEVLMVSNLGLSEIDSIKELRIENEFLSLIYEGLKQGKKVYSLSKDIEINPVNKGLVKKIKKLIGQLDELGLKMITRTKQENIVLEKDVITIADVNNIETGPILLKRNAVITSPARDYLKEAGIEILRR